MFKRLAIHSATILALSCCPLALADNLDPNTIQQIHAKVKSTFIEKCKKEMTGSNDAICNCLADKAQANLDDAALSQCANDESGASCVIKAVSDASAKAMSQDSITACTQQQPAAIAPAPTPAAPAATAPAAPAPATTAPVATPTTPAATDDMSTDTSTPATPAPADSGSDNSDDE
jgi:hypothetical protein